MTRNNALFDLKGHVALVTGGNGGLGLAMAKGLVKAGATLAIWGRNRDKNAAAIAELQALGGTALAFEADVTDPASSSAAFARTLEAFGRVDSCFANAGGPGVRGRFIDLDRSAWSATHELNVLSVIETFQLATRHWLAQGSRGKLIVTSSVAALVGLPNSAGYCMTKAAVTGLVRSLAIELGSSGIQVNAILPGFIETEMSLNTPKAFQDGCRRRVASGSIGKLEDMEGIAVYLASRQSDFMTGQVVVLDGGHTIFPL
ncbi:MAG: SDR family NAD(P)-dependent oxidoreductase [Phycisphaerales bacterium]